MRHLGNTPPFRGAHGETLPGSIAEVGYRRLGGLDQWVMLRGKDVANPPLILLHGGPGWSETRFFRLCNAPLERSFTVVYCDQRGAGKSFDRDISPSSMTVEQFISDLNELVDAVCRRLGQSKVVIFGHSWGSALGVLYAARFPEKVAAYVGSGQYGDAATGEAASYAYALREAERRGKRRALKKLRAIGPPPHTRKQLMIERTCVARLEGSMRPAKWWDLLRVALGVSESSIIDLPRIMRGFRFSLEAMWEEASQLNLCESAPALEMPVFFSSRPLGHDGADDEAVGRRRGRWKDVAELVLGDGEGMFTWALVLEPLDESSTRLLVRARAVYESRVVGLMLRLVWRPIHFGMQRRQLLTVKRRVEAGGHG